MSRIRLWILASICLAPLSCAPLSPPPAAGLETAVVVPQPSTSVPTATIPHAGAYPAPEHTSVLATSVPGVGDPPTERPPAAWTYGPAVVSNGTNEFSVAVPEGWVALTQAGITSLVVYSYDTMKFESAPPDAVIATYSVVERTKDVSLEAYVSDTIEINRSAYEEGALDPAMPFVISSAETVVIERWSGSRFTVLTNDSYAEHIVLEADADRFVYLIIWGHKQIDEETRKDLLQRLDIAR